MSRGRHRCPKVKNTNRVFPIRDKISTDLGLPSEVQIPKWLNLSMSPISSPWKDKVWLWAVPALKRHFAHWRRCKTHPKHTYTIAQTFACYKSGRFLCEIYQFSHEDRDISVIMWITKLKIQGETRQSRWALCGNDSRFGFCDGAVSEVIGGCATPNSARQITVSPILPDSE